MIEPTIYDEAINLWGRDAQINQLIEEMAELTVATSHWKRGRGSLDSILEEMADVEIMLEQIKAILPSNEAIKKEKLLRLRERIKRSKEHRP